MGNSTLNLSPCRGLSCFIGYLGISRQGYYRHVDRTLEREVLRTSIVLYCQEVLHEMPKAGMRQLYELSRRKFGKKFTIGRDQCFKLFRSNGLCQRRRKRPRTTNSNHNYFIYPDLLNTSPKLKAVRFGQLCVTDITYVATSSGWAYLSLVTDAAARLIVGWDLHPTLAKAGPLKVHWQCHGLLQAAWRGPQLAHPPLRPWRAVLLQRVR
ncbi:MAG: hypothetical protein LKE41_12610 [Prevotella sp.]|nr:hypothetical protein [Prevotella sp.]